MTHINLLDWRARERKQREKEFGAIALIAALIGAGIAFGVFQFFSSGLDYQNQRNRIIEGEIKSIDQKIKEIEELERVKEDLLSRMKIIEELQQSRSQIVHFFDELVSTLPDGVFLTKISQRASVTRLEGVAESHGRVSTYMKNLDASPWIRDPVLVVIRTKDEKRRRVSEFQLQIKLNKVAGGKAPSDEDEEG